MVKLLKTVQCLYLSKYFTNRGAMFSRKGGIILREAGYIHPQGTYFSTVIQWVMKNLTFMSKGFHSLDVCSNSRLALAGFGSSTVAPGEEDLWGDSRAHRYTQAGIKEHHKLIYVLLDMWLQCILDKLTQSLKKEKQACNLDSSIHKNKTTHRTWPSSPRDFLSFGYHSSTKVDFLHACFSR